MTDNPRPITPRLIVDGYARRTELIPTARQNLIEVTVRHFIVGDIITDGERSLELEEVAPLVTVDITSPTDIRARLHRQLQRDTMMAVRYGQLGIGERALEHLEWLHGNTPRGYLSDEGERMVKVTHTELAADISTIRESLTKELRRLKDEGSVRLDYGKITLLF